MTSRACVPEWCESGQEPHDDVCDNAPMRPMTKYEFVGFLRAAAEQAIDAYAFLTADGAWSRETRKGAAGRPKARGLDSGYDGDALEVVRVCTTGTRNACSMIYGALCRAGEALGYDPIYTYTLQSECASCVRASGFVVDAELDARPGWDTRSRPRVNVDLFGEERTPTEAKIRWIRRRVA